MSARHPARKSAAAAHHTALYLDERDAIDTAKGRIRRLARLAELLLRHGTDTVEDDEAIQLGLADVFEIISGDVEAIDAAFALADVRRETDGGAR